MSRIPAYGAESSKSPLDLMTIERRSPGSDDVEIDIEFCGVCHSDLHFTRDDWGMAKYPIVPGHEIVGRVTAVGPEVKNFHVGDSAAVGCMVDSCLRCDACHAHLEQHCLNGFTMTYGSDVDGGGVTQGGYSKRIVVREHFVLQVPSNLDKAAVAPLLCAGITTYSPLKQYAVQQGMTVGIVGLGGLGHMGVKLAAALGAKVVMITTSPSKGEDAKRLGAHEVLLSSDSQAMEKSKGVFDFVLNTIPVAHDVNPYLDLLRYNSTMCCVGAIEPLPAVDGGKLAFGRKALAGSLIGGIAETQELLEFCGQHNIVADIEKVQMPDINVAFKRMEKNDVKYRFVIDVAGWQP